MKFYYPEIHTVFDTNCCGVNTIVVENKRLFNNIIEDILSQIQGSPGKSIISTEGKELSVAKKAELFSSFVPFVFNERKLITKILSRIDEDSSDIKYIERRSQLLADCENLIDDLTFELSCNLSYNSLNFISILKSIGIKFEFDGGGILEKLLNVIEWISEFEGEKLFFTVNLRTFVEDNELDLFLNTIHNHHYNLIMIESISLPKLENEIRYTIDSDLCEF